MCQHHLHLEILQSTWAGYFNYPCHSQGTCVRRIPAWNAGMTPSPRLFVSRKFSTLMLVLTFIMLVASSYGDMQLPPGKYCAQAYSPRVSEVYVSPSGRVSINLITPFLRATIANAVHHVDEDTGLIYVNGSMLHYGAEKFPYISHQWNMRYDALKDEVQFFSLVTSGYIAFKAGCKVVRQPRVAPRPHVPINNPLNNISFCSQTYNKGFGPGEKGYIEFHGSDGFNADFVSYELYPSSVTLYNVKYRREGPNEEGTELLTIQIPEHLPDNSVFPHLGYYFTLRYNAKAGTVIISGPRGGPGLVMTTTDC